DQCSTSCSELTERLTVLHFLSIKKPCIQIVQINITYCVRRSDARDERSVYGCSPHHGLTRSFSRQGNLFGSSCGKRECRPHIREEIAFEALQCWSGHHYAGQERREHPYAFS